MKLHEEGDAKWFDSLEDVKSDGYFPIKVNTPLQYYTLKGRTTALQSTNITPIRYLQWLLYAPAEKRFYMRLFRAWDLETFYFYRKSLTFSGEDTAVNNLRNYIEDGNVYLAITKQQISDTTELLLRLYRAQFKKDGKVEYPIFIRLLKESLDLEDYKDKCKELPGHKTVCHQYEERINDLWAKAQEKK
jgi:hypothetical protein